MDSDNLLQHAIATENIFLQLLLETRDDELFRYVAQRGDVETARLLLERYPDSYDLNTDTMTAAYNPKYFLVCAAAYWGNAAIFQFLVEDYPFLLAVDNPHVVLLLKNSIVGGRAI